MKFNEQMKHIGCLRLSFLSCAMFIILMNLMRILSAFWLIIHWELLFDVPIQPGIAKKKSLTVHDTKSNWIYGRAQRIRTQSQSINTFPSMLSTRQLIKSMEKTDEFSVKIAHGMS